MVKFTITFVMKHSFFHCNKYRTLILKKTMIFKTDEMTSYMILY